MEGGTSKGGEMQILPLMLLMRVGEREKERLKHDWLKKNELDRR